LDISADGFQLASVSHGGLIDVYDIVQGRSVMRIDQPGTVQRAVFFGTGGKEVIVGGGETVTVFGDEKKVIGKWGAGGTVWSMALRGKTGEIVVGTGAGQIVVISTGNEKLREVYDVYKVGGVRSVCCSVDGSTAVSHFNCNRKVVESGRKLRWGFGSRDSGAGGC
jgi:hypothetical protein